LEPAQLQPLDYEYNGMPQRGYQLGSEWHIDQWNNA
jgi:hypothetical protein